MNELSIFESLPAGFLESSAADLYKILPGPSLIHLRGKLPENLFASVLLHGNEDVGLQAVQRFLRQQQEKTLPKGLILFVGNVAAAAKGMRRLDDQLDYNRVWLGGEDCENSPEHSLVCDVMHYARAQKLFASVDFHNNTGLNPHYACVNRLDHRFFHLATLFNRTVVYFTRPHGVQSMAMAELCPSVTVECGRAGDELGYAHASEYLSALMHLHEIPEHPVASHDIDLYHTVATVKVPEQYSFGFGFGEEETDIQFLPELDHLNFRELAPDTLIGRTRAGGTVHFEVIDENGEEVEAEYFRFENSEIRFAKGMMPSMLTLDAKVIRQDCLCYLMERYPLKSSVSL
ncbi:MAG: M14 family metallopeptidase [Gammaproteobacteria bacterium]|nr:M14 family metallopeptidase [Gammaproteobacteria bacterium]